QHPWDDPTEPAKRCSHPFNTRLDRVWSGARTTHRDDRAESPAHRIHADKSARPPVLHDLRRRHEVRWEPERPAGDTGVLDRHVSERELANARANPIAANDDVEHARASVVELRGDAVERFADPANRDTEADAPVVDRRPQELDQLQAAHVDERAVVPREWIEREGMQRVAGFVGDDVS